jgi:hypothetical protein
VSLRLNPVQRQILDHLDARPVDLDPDTLIDAATARTGRHDFGPGWTPRWRPSMRIPAART